MAAVCGQSTAEAREAIAEARADPVLRERVRRAAATRWWWSKRQPPLGKRLGWYALARLTRPHLIIETGVHDGLGSLVLLRALERNAQRGADGVLVSFDVNPAAGWLVGTDPRWELRLQSSRDGLAEVAARSSGVGMFIHDSMHTYDHERWELSTVAPRLTPGGVLVSDNVHATRALADTCAEFGLEYHEFAERPAAHFYPGGAIGAGRRVSPRSASV